MTSFIKMRIASMTDVFLTNIASWMQTHPTLAIIACLLWGIFSVGLSPCQLATVSILSTPSVVNSHVAHKIPKLMLGHAIALFIIGAVLIFFSFQMDFMGHYWTVPFGILFIYLAKQLLQKHHCTHCSPHDESTFLHKALQKITKSSMSFMSFGFVYGILSSTCVLIYLSPILILAKHQSIELVLACNAAFAIGHTLPIFIVNMLANSIHKLMCTTESIFTIPRRLAAIAFALIGLVLIAHPFLELAGFDFHGHSHEIHEQHTEHKHEHKYEQKPESHSNDSHKHEPNHNHGEHKHRQDEHKHVEECDHEHHNHEHSKH